VIRHIFTVIIAAGMLALNANAGRYESFTQKAAQGDKLQVVAATFFGGTGIEEFLDAGGLPDGTIVAFGNAWGPEFPATPPATVLGKGQHRKVNPYGASGKGGDRSLRTDSPDMAGMIVLYGSKLETIRKVVRFDWGVASLSAGLVGRDGKSLFTAGRCTDAFRDVAKSAKVFKTQPAAGTTSTGRKPRTEPSASADAPRDVYVAKWNATADKLEWVWIFEGQRQPPERLWVTDAGELYADANGLWRISADGQTARRIGDAVSTGTAEYLGVDPKDGSFYFGGDRNTNTGYQPWRQPYLYKFDNTGKKLWRMWEWPPRDCACGGNGNNLCSDSSPRSMEIASNGHLWVGGWSDGGNSVFGRQPTDISKPVPRGGFGMEGSGMKGANSLGYLMRIDPATQTVLQMDLWLAYVPMTFADAKHRGAPNFTNIERIRTLPGDALGFCGKAATGLIQTPNAFYRYPDDGRKYGGEYAAAFSSDFKTLLFSSYLPGCHNVRIGASKSGMIIVSRSNGTDGVSDRPTLTPVVNPLQKEKKGDLDAHIILLSP
jgi:hypothetical protein